MRLMKKIIYWFNNKNKLIKKQFKYNNYNNKSLKNKLIMIIYNLIKFKLKIN